MKKYLRLYVLVTCMLALAYGQQQITELIQMTEMDFKGISDSFIKGVEELLDKSANYREIHSELSKLEYKQEGGKGEDMLKTFVDGLQESFADKTEVLKGIQQKVQNAEKEHKHAKNMNKDALPFTYLNMRDIEPDDESSLVLEKSFSDSFKINLTNSFVQVPTNIYAYKSEVLNIVEWTKKIDDSFTKNFQNSNQSLLYQYYGDSSGVFRIYPGNVIGVKPNDGETDLYDCRRRVWYIQASASPKDVVIIIDMSGSMIGNNIGIARITTSSLIDTLQENDFFNVITVNNSIKYVHEHINYLIQATKENKEMMKQKVQNISAPTDIIDADVGMEEAFKILARNPNENNTRPSANCNQAIMFITDGVEGEYAAKKTMEKYNADKKVRVFSFLVGRMKNPDKTALIAMSCDNHGHFYAIETLGNVWDTVLDYLQVMSRPIAKAYDEGEVKLSYTPAYLDSAGFDMIMSVSLSVFNKVKDADNKDVHNKLIGVVGTDISLKNLMYKIPQSKLTPFSRGFVINNNGFILIHPKFRKQEGYLPTPPNILLDDLEYSTDPQNSTDLKIQMLNLIGAESTNVDETEFPTYWLYDHNRKITENRTRYFYQHVNGTDFVAAIALVDLDKYLDVVLDSNSDKYKSLIKKGRKALNGSYAILGHVNDTKSEFVYVKIAPWNYCSDVKPGADKPKGIKHYPEASELFNALERGETSVDSCDQELIRRLLIPAGIVDDATGKWQLLNSTVDAVFFATSGGFFKYMTSSNETVPYDRDVIRTDIFENAVANPRAKIIASTPPRKGKTSTNQPVHVTMMSSSRASWIVNAVLGAKINSDHLNEVFMNATLNDNRYDKCRSNNTAMCAIIDHSGFIIASNQYSKYTGRFLGERSGFLVDEMVEKNILKKFNLKDTQAECAISDEDTSSANFLLTPAKLLINTFLVVCKSLHWLLIQLGIFIMSLMRPDASQVGAQKPRTIQVSCTKELTFYRVTDEFLNKENTFVKGSFLCQPNPKKCQNQPYALYGMNGTNMLLLIVEADEDCGCFAYQIPIEPIKIPETDKWGSKPPPTFNYRKEPMACFNSTGEKSTKDACGGANHIKLSLLTLAIALVLTRLMNSLL